MVGKDLLGVQEVIAPEKLMYISKFTIIYSVYHIKQSFSKVPL